MEKKNGFTILEMMIVMLIVATFVDYFAKYSTKGENYS